MDELNKRDLGLKCKLTAIEQAMDAFTKLDLEEQVRKYVADLRVEMEELIHANPQTAEKRIDERCEIHVKFRADFASRVGGCKELTIPSM